MKNACFFILLLVFGCNEPPTGCPPESFAALQKLLAYNPQRSRPLIMAHRGGPNAGLPENCIPAFEYTLSRLSCPLLEFDVRMTADSVLILCHDDDLARTTTGTGSLSGQTWSALQPLKLKAMNGSVTTFSIPTFDEILRWGTGKPAILIIDNKPGTDLKRVLLHIQKAGIQNQAVLICYSVEDAQTAHRILPDLMLALGFNDAARIQAIQASGLPNDHLIALTPRELQSADFYTQIHRMGISCSLGTNGNVDTLPADQARPLYEALFKNGVDIICTDEVEKIDPD